MPDYSDLRDIKTRLDHLSSRINRLEHVVSKHVGACGEMNKSHDQFEARTREKVHALQQDVAAIKHGDNWKMGWLAGASAVGSLVGAAGAATILRTLFGGG